MLGQVREELVTIIGINPIPESFCNRLQLMSQFSTSFSSPSFVFIVPQFQSPLSLKVAEGKGEDGGHDRDCVRVYL